MKPRLIVLLLLAVFLVSGTTAVAAALPARCPSGTHEQGWGEFVCVSDQRHMAPSGAGFIPYYVTAKDQRVATRIELAFGGIIVACVLIVSASWDRKKSAQIEGQPVAVA